MSHFITQIYRNNKNYKGIVFLDRDGTINKDVNYLSDKAQIEILPKVPSGLRVLNQNSICVVVITNQPVVARGVITIRGLRKLNDTLSERLKKEGAYIDAIYSCPHHPERNHPDIPERAMKYRIVCECRKPKVAMLRKAVEDFNINLETAFIVGDRTEDIKAGENLGIKTILVETGYGGRDNKYPVSPDYISKDFANAVQFCIKRLI